MSIITDLEEYKALNQFLWLKGKHEKLPVPQYQLIAILDSDAKKSANKLAFSLGMLGRKLSAELLELIDKLHLVFSPLPDFKVVDELDDLDLALAKYEEDRSFNNAYSLGAVFAYEPNDTEQQIEKLTALDLLHKG